MSPWAFSLTVDPREATPLFLQIVRAISDDIGRGRLRPGDALPGSRALADQLGVHRSTVVAAYAELAAQGWTSARPRGATVVATTSPDVPPRRASRRLPVRRRAPPALGFALRDPAPKAFAIRAPAPPGALALWGGVPDVRLIPLDRLGRALRRAARLGGGAVLSYSGEGRGHPRLRAALAAMVSSTRGLAASADDVMVTQGSQMALHLIGRALLAPGDRVAVESPGYRRGWGAFERAGARLCPVPVDDEGVDVAALEALHRRTPLRAIYVTPHHQYPTTVTLSPRRRLALLALAQRHHLAIIEDDYDHEFHYDGRPVLPLASADTGGHVIYVGTLAKVLAPGLRVGFVVAPAPLLARLTEERTLIDWHGSHVIEAAVAELMEDGEVQRHVRRVRRLYQQRRDVLCATLDRHLAGALSFKIPAGGMALWARAARGLDVEIWRTRALERGLVFQTGRDSSFSGGALPYLRLGFALCNERELELATRRLAQSRP